MTEKKHSGLDIFEIVGATPRFGKINMTPPTTPNFELRRMGERDTALEEAMTRVLRRAPTSSRPQRE